MIDPSVDDVNPQHARHNIKEKDEHPASYNAASSGAITIRPIHSQLLQAGEVTIPNFCRERHRTVCKLNRLFSLMMRPSSFASRPFAATSISAVKPSSPISLPRMFRSSRFGSPPLSISVARAALTLRLQ